MKIVTIRFKKGIRRKIKDTQKEYEYMCPIDTITVGDYVLLEVKIKKRHDFQVGRIESVLDIDEWDSKEKTKLLPYGFVVCKIPVKDMDKRCADIRRMKNRTLRNNKKRSNLINKNHN